MLSTLQPLVSIVTPVYNGLPYLKEAIKSVLAQDYPNIELIVLDDGSTDGTQELLKQYAGKFYYESHKNMGQAKTLNKGWQMCKGEIIGYLAADDILASDAVSTTVEYFRKNPGIILTYPDNNLIDANSKLIQTLTAPEHDYHKLVSLMTSYIWVGSFFLKKIFDEVGGWDTQYRLIADYKYQLRLAKIGEFKHIPKILGHHRVHSGSITRSVLDAERADEPKKMMKELLATTQDKKLLKMKNCIISRAYLLSGRMHMDARRFGTGINYFIKAFFLYPRHLFTLHIYRFFTRIALKPILKTSHHSESSSALQR